MPRQAAPRAFRPSLECLEHRELPSGLLPTLQNLNNNLNTSANNFRTDQALVAGYQANPPAGGSNVIGPQYGKAVVDYQQMISDQFAIQQTGAADIAAINFGTFASGNAALFAFAVFFIDPQFQKVVNEANGTVSGVSGQANQTYNFSPLPIGALPSIASHVGVT